jgi:hypothetical protein
LTGIDAHSVVGKPIGSLLRVAEFAEGSIRPDDGQHAELPTQDNEGAAIRVTDSQYEGDLFAAEATGRARAEASRRESEREAVLERLVAASGFGRIQLVQAVAKSHQMVGRNVTIIVGAPRGYSARDEGSKATSISSNCEGPPRLIQCQASIAPIVSAPESVDSFKNEKDPDHEQSKRRKHQGGTETEPQKKDPGQHRRHQNRPLITHYVIQIEPHNTAPVNKEGGDSLSSNASSVEARLLGLTKTGLQQQLAAVAPAMELARGPEFLADDEASEASETRIAVTAVG